MTEMLEPDQRIANKDTEYISRYEDVRDQSLQSKTDIEWIRESINKLATKEKLESFATREDLANTKFQLTAAWSAAAVAIISALAAIIAAFRQ